jgi:hypothetical protein
MDIVIGFYMQFHVLRKDPLCGKHRYYREEYIAVLVFRFNGVSKEYRIIGECSS